MNIVKHILFGVCWLVVIAFTYNALFSQEITINREVALEQKRLQNEPTKWVGVKEVYSPSKDLDGLSKLLLQRSFKTEVSHGEGQIILQSSSVNEHEWFQFWQEVSDFSKNSITYSTLYLKECALNLKGLGQLEAKCTLRY